MSYYNSNRMINKIIIHYSATGTLPITENGTYNIATYEKVNVNVPQLDTTDATATANDIVSGKTAYVNGSKVTGTYAGIIPSGTATANKVLKGFTFYGNGTTKQNGTIETYTGSTTITSNQTIQTAGMYLNNDIVVNVAATPTQEKTITITENGTTEVTPDSGKNLSKVTITANVANSEVEEVSTSSAMDALLIQANLGKAYKYVGTTDDKYTNGDIYEVEEA